MTYELIRLQALKQTDIVCDKLADFSISVLLVREDFKEWLRLMKAWGKAEVERKDVS